MYMLDEKNKPRTGFSIDWRSNMILAAWYRLKPGNDLSGVEAWAKVIILAA